MARSAAGVYAQALFELAEEQGMEAFLEEASGLETLISENPDFEVLLSHPRITKEEKISTLDATFSGKLSGEFLGFLKLLVEKDRAASLMDILEEFTSRAREALGIGRVYVSSAVPLDEERSALLEEKLLSATSYKKLETDYKVDPGLIGGMVIRIGDRIVDDSLKTKLYRLEKDLL